MWNEEMSELYQKSKLAQIESRDAEAIFPAGKDKAADFR